MSTSRVSFILGRPWTSRQWVKWGVVLALAAAALAWSARDLNLSLS